MWCSLKCWRFLLEERKKGREQTREVKRKREIEDRKIVTQVMIKANGMRMRRKNQNEWLSVGRCWFKEALGEKMKCFVCMFVIPKCSRGHRLIPTKQRL